MTERRLGDKAVQISIAHLLEEARLCARTRRANGVLGLAAMATVFACVNAVGEALLGKRATGKAIEEFYSVMDDKTSWVMPPRGKEHDDSEVKEMLVGIRNGLLHALALPPGTRLSANGTRTTPSKQWTILVPEFIDAVKKTIEGLSQDQLSRRWDPGNRGEAKGSVDTFPEVSAPADLTFLTYDTSGITMEPSSAGSAAVPDFSDEEGS